jgi:hypothetical protein
MTTRERSCWICGDPIPEAELVMVSHGRGHPHFLSTRSYHDVCYRSNGGDAVERQSTVPSKREDNDE